MSEQRLMHHRWRADAEFAALSLGARDLFYGLMGICDSWGCLKVNPVPIRNQVYLGAEVLPDLSQITDWLTELREAGFLCYWEDGDKVYAEVKWFMDEQRIRYRRRRETPVPPWRNDDGEKTIETLGNASDAAPPAKRQRRSAAEEKRREEKRREENNQEHEACQEVPSTPSQGAPEGSRLLYEHLSDLMARDGHNVQKAWGLILSAVGPWGGAARATVMRLFTRARTAPVYALASALDIAGNEKVHSPWGALNHALKQKDWCPSDANLQRAKDMIRGSPAPRNGVGTIGETLKEMGGEA